MSQRPVFLCIYQSGKVFQAEHVKRLYDQVKRHAPNDLTFICLTDKAGSVRKYGIETLPLEHGWHTFWCKMELMKIRGPVLYMDLDVTILRDITPFLEASKRHRLAVIKHLTGTGINSSVMAWNGDISELYREFVNRPDLYMAKYQKKKNNIPERRYIIGDQGFIGEKWRHGFTYWQDIMPSAVLSYKWQWVKGYGNPDRVNCRVVFFHGTPRPWEVDELHNA